MARGQRSGEREKLWRDVLARFGKSGLSVRAFCRQERLSEPLFYAWRRIVAERDAEAGASHRTVLQPPECPAFLPVTIQRDAVPPTPSISLELRGGRTLRLPQSMPVERLAEFIHALEARALEAAEAKQ
jgi:hypothetical protein